jgi:hypothetical protein
MSSGAVTRAIAIAQRASRQVRSRWFALGFLLDVDESTSLFQNTGPVDSSRTCYLLCLPVVAASLQ